MEALVVKWLLSLEIETENRVQMLIKAVCISNSANANILSPLMDKS